MGGHFGSHFCVMRPLSDIISHGNSGRVGMSKMGGWPIFGLNFEVLKNRLTGRGSDSLVPCGRMPVFQSVVLPGWLRTAH